MSNNQEEYLNQKDLGKYLGAGPKRLGGWLADQGLRVMGGNPLPKAFAIGLVRQRANGMGRPGYHYVWHKEKTLKLLEEAGHKRLSDQELEASFTFDGPLVGPFEIWEAHAGWFGIKNAKGEFCARLDDRKSAEWTTEMLNLAHQYGKLPPVDD